MWGGRLEHPVYKCKSVSKKVEDCTVTHFIVFIFGRHTRQLGQPFEPVYSDERERTRLIHHVIDYHQFTHRTAIVTMDIKPVSMQTVSPTQNTSSSHVEAFSFRLEFAIDTRRSTLPYISDKMTCRTWYACLCGCPRWIVMG